MPNSVKNNYLNDKGREPTRAGQATNSENNPREFMWSATAVSFGALMAVLESYTKMRQEQMHLSNKVSTAIATATIAEGQAQVDAGYAQAEGTREQGYASMAQAFGSGVGIIGSGLGAWKAASASSAVKPMSDLTDQVNAKQFNSPQVVAGNNANPADPTVSNLQNKLIQGQLTASDFLTPDSNGGTGLNKVLGTDQSGKSITLETLFQTATDKTQLNNMQTAVGKVRDTVLANYQSQQAFANNIIGTFQSVGSLVGSAGSSSYASMQATAQQNAALAQQAVTFAAALQQFSNGTYSNIRQSASYADQGVSGTFSFILNMENNEMRG